MRLLYFRRLWQKLFPPATVYLDYAAATPMWPAAIASMQPYLSIDYANPSAIHGPGLLARRAVEQARQQIATRLGVQSTGVIFTSNGTESNNIFLQGIVEKHKQAGIAYPDMTILSTRLEHAATVATLEQLEQLGVKVVWLPVDSTGRVDQIACKKALTEKVIALTIGYCNSEVGTIESVGALGRLVRVAEKHWGTRIYLHIDAAQAPLWLPCQLARLKADCAAFDAGKYGGPKGVGILVWQKHVAFAPIQYGGGQERGLRPGTENVAGIVAAATALDIAQCALALESRVAQVTAVRDYALTALQQAFPEALINGPAGEHRVANNVNISIPGLDTEYAIISLAAQGIAASTKSACSSAGGSVSAVVQAMTGDSARAQSTLRFTLGPDISRRQIDRLISALQAHVRIVRPVH